MKNLLKKLLTMSFCFFFVFVLVACGDGGKKPSTYEEMTLEEYQAYVLADLNGVVDSFADEVSAEIMAAVSSEKAAGVAAISAAKDVAGVMAAYKEAKDKIAACIPAIEDGVHTLIDRSQADKTRILGVLEAYAVRNGMTGISLFEDGGYTMYNPRVTLGTENYIVGYGFGTLAEGSITADLATENNAAWKRYYHTFDASDPGTANYLNDQGSEVGDFYGYIGASYFTTFMNDEKNGYDWVPELAKEKPVAGELDEEGKFVATGAAASTLWRFEVKVGAEAKYNTNSTLADRAAFDGREVEAEDYLTPFKLLLTQSNALFRGGEMASGSKKASSIKGAHEFYAGTAGGFNQSLWDNVGLKVYEEDGKTYFQFEFLGPQTAFYAMYYISSSLYMPVPQAFLDLVGVKNYLGFNEDQTSSPVDNSLSLGAYTLERWDSGQQVVYAKNPYYVHGKEKYSIPGIHINILTAAKEDTEAGFKEFLAGKIDAAGIPQTRLEEFKNDPRTRTTKGSSVFKLNVNATSSETWEKLFGVNGSAVKTEPSDYWVVEPCLSNPHFIKGLSLSINRPEFAAARGNISSVDYLSSNYMSDPENGISYSVTDEHKKAVAGLLPEKGGYDLELAREYFRVAIMELEAAGKLTPGTKANPAIIKLEIAWQVAAHEERYHNEIKQYLEAAFNHSSVSDGRYKLEIEFWVGSEWSDVYYNKMMLGQFDIGFGSISGNSLNPLDFMSVLSADLSISGNFTLNWGVDTNSLTDDILVFEGKRWTYDALWTAANSTAIIQDHVLVKEYTHKDDEPVISEDGSYTITTTVTFALPEFSDCGSASAVIYGGSGAAYQEEDIESTVVISEDKKTVTITVVVSGEVLAKYAAKKDNKGIDIYLGLQGGQPDYAYSIPVDFQVKAAE